MSYYPGNRNAAPSGTGSADRNPMPLPMPTPPQRLRSSALHDFVAHHIDQPPGAAAAAAAAATSSSSWLSTTEDCSSSLNIIDDTLDRWQSEVAATPTSSKCPSSIFEPSEMTGRSTECVVANALQQHPHPHQQPRDLTDESALSEDFTAGSMSAVTAKERCSLANSSLGGAGGAASPDDPLLMSTEQILGQSISEDVRQLAVGLQQLKMRQSYGLAAGHQQPEEEEEEGEELAGRPSMAPSFASLPRTADMSFESTASRGAAFGNDFAMDNSADSLRTAGDAWSGLEQLKALDVSKLSKKLDEYGASFSSDAMGFRSEQLSAFFDNEQREFVEEFAVLPDRKTQSSLESGATYDVDERRERDDLRRQQLNDSDFGSQTPRTNHSMGNYFATRSENLRTIIPHDSPQKPRIAMQSESPEESLCQSIEPVMSISKISKLLDAPVDSSQGFIKRILKNVPAEFPLKPMAPNVPLDDILFISKSMPVPVSTSDNVRILEVQKVLYSKQPPQRILQQSASGNCSAAAAATALTPNRRHIVSKAMAKDAPQPAVDEIANKENMAGTMQRFLCDTVSCTDSMLELSEIDVRSVHSSASANAGEMLAAESAAGAEAPYATRTRSLLAPVDDADDIDGDRHSTPPLHPDRRVTRGIKYHPMQSKSRLTPLAAQPLSPDDEVAPPSAHLSPPIATHLRRRSADDATHEGQPGPKPVASAFAADTSNKSSVASSTFSSPGFCSSKSELMYVTDGGGGSGASAGAAGSQFGGSHGELHTTGHELSALKSSESELGWGSTKLRRSSTKRFTLKNMSARKLSLKMEVVGPGFQLAGGSGPSACGVTLQSQECRTIAVTFCPTVMGAAVGQVLFFNADDSPAGRSVSLFGYGGNTVMQVLGTTRAPIGTAFLSFGDHRELTMSAAASTVQQTFTVYNRGPLNGMAVVFLKPSVCAKDALRVVPSRCVLGAESQQQFVVSLQPRRAELRKMFRKQSGAVVTVGTVEIYYGDDANRQRMARLLPRLLAKDGQQPYDRLVQFCSGFGGFDDQQQVDAQFEQFDETPERVHDLFGLFKSEEIALTVERTLLNETTDSEPDQMSGLEETMLFQTLKPVVAESPMQRMGSMLAISSAHLAEAAAPVQPIAAVARPWSIYPLRMQLNAMRPGVVRELRIVLHSGQPQTFELVCQPPRTLEMRPMAGELRSMEEQVVQVRLIGLPPADEDVVLGVYMENDRLEVKVDVLNRLAAAAAAAQASDAGNRL